MSKPSENITEELVREIFELDNRYKKIEDSESGKTGDIHFQRRQEVRKLRFELMELLPHTKALDFEDIKRKLGHQAILLERMEEESNNNTTA